VDFKGLKPIGLSLARSGPTLRVNLESWIHRSLIQSSSLLSVATPGESAIGNWEVLRRAQLKEK
jgi:hypothetical protein